MLVEPTRRDEFSGANFTNLSDSQPAQRRPLVPRLQSGRLPNQSARLTMRWPFRLAEGEAESEGEAASSNGQDGREMEVIIAGAALAGSCAGAFYLQKAALEVLFRTVFHH